MTILLNPPTYASRQRQRYRIIDVRKHPKYRNYGPNIRRSIDCTPYEIQDHPYGDWLAVVGAHYSTRKAAVAALSVILATEEARKKQQQRGTAIALILNEACANQRPTLEEFATAIHVALDATEPESSVFRDALEDYQRQLGRMAEQLGAGVPPGHVDYVSKAGAASWAQTLATEIGQLLGETSATEPTQIGGAE